MSRTVQVIFLRVTREVSDVPAGPFAAKRIAAGPFCAACGAERGFVRDLSAAVFTEHADAPFVLIPESEADEINMQYHTIKSEKINRKPEKNEKKTMRRSFGSAFSSGKCSRSGKKWKTADKMAAFFGNGIAFFKKCGIFSG